MVVFQKFEGKTAPSKFKIQIPSSYAIFFPGFFNTVVYDKSDHCLPGQNGIWVKFQRFWPKNDDEKWSRKNIFEIPPCAHHVIFITEFVLLIKIH